MFLKRAIPLVATAVLFLLTVPAVLADGPTPVPMPDVPVREREVVTVEDGQEVHTLIVEMDVYPTHEINPDEIAPDGFIPGGSGQSGTLSAMIGYYSATFPPWRARGGAKITLTGSPTASAWPIFSIAGVQQEDATGSPCWTTSSCTKWTSYYNAFNGDEALTFAQTTIMWSSGGSTTADATATKTL